MTVKSNDNPKDIWAVAYGKYRNSCAVKITDSFYLGQLKGHKVIAVGYEDGNIKLFNVNNAHYLWETHVKDGVCSIDFDKDVLRVSTISGAFIVNIDSGKLTEILVKYSHDI